MIESRNQTAQTGYEPKDVDVVAMAWLFLAFLLCGIAIHFIVAGVIEALNNHSQEADRPEIRTVTAPQFPPPRLQVSPTDDLVALRKHEDDLLATTGWIDRGKARIHIPIDRAKELLVERGLPKTTESVTPTELQKLRPDQNAPVGPSTPGAVVK